MLAADDANPPRRRAGRLRQLRLRRTKRLFTTGAPFLPAMAQFVSECTSAPFLAHAIRFRRPRLLPGQRHAEPPPHPVHRLCGQAPLAGHRGARPEPAFLAKEAFELTPFFGRQPARVPRARFGGSDNASVDLLGRPRRLARGCALLPFDNSGLPNLKSSYSGVTIPN